MSRPDQRSQGRYRNVRRLDVYLAAVDRGERPRAGQDEVRGADAERERLMLGIRRAAGVATGDSDDPIRADPEMARMLDAGVAAILEAWESLGGEGLLGYPAGTWGPPEAASLFGDQPGGWRRL